MRRVLAISIIGALLLSACATSESTVSGEPNTEETAASLSAEVPVEVPQDRLIRRPTQTADPNLTAIRSRLYEEPFMPALVDQTGDLESFLGVSKAYSQQFKQIRELLEEEIAESPEHEGDLRPVLRQLATSAAKAARFSKRSSQKGQYRGAWELFMVDWHCSVMALGRAIERIDGTPFSESVRLLPENIAGVTSARFFIQLNDLRICNHFEEGFPRLVTKGDIGKVTPDWFSFEDQWIQQNVGSDWVIALSPLLFTPFAFDEESTHVWTQVLTGARYGKCGEYFSLGAKFPHTPTRGGGACI